MLRVARCAQQKAFDRAPLTRQTNRAYRSTSDPQRAQCGARQFHIIFGHDDVSGRRFDVALILISSAGILVALLDSVGSMHAQKTSCTVRRAGNINDARFCKICGTSRAASAD